MKGRLTKVSSAALPIAGAPAIRLGIISTGGGFTPIVLAAVSLFTAAKMVKNSIQRKG